MRHLWRTTLTVIGFLALAAGHASAQYFTQPFGGGLNTGRPPQFPGAGTPALSPYLNLLRGGDLASNYYLGVLPEIDRRRNARTFSQDIATLQQEVNRSSPGFPDFDPDLPRNASLPPSGHGSTFANTGTFFPFPTQRTNQGATQMGQRPRPGAGPGVAKGPG
jgi:hypothetical protein